MRSITAKLLLLKEQASREQEPQLIQHGAALPVDVPPPHRPWPPSMQSSTTDTICICASFGAFRRTAYLTRHCAPAFLACSSTAVTCKTPPEPAAAAGLPDHVVTSSP
jgi:hypothetical protein